MEREAVARVHVGRTEKGCQAFPVRRVERNERADVGRNPSTPAAELVEIVQLGLIGSEHQEHGLVDRLGDLVELERRDGMAAVREVALEAAVELGCMLKVTREGYLGEARGAGPA